MQLDAGDMHAQTGQKRLRGGPHARARFTSAGGAAVEPRLGALPDELLVQIVRAVGLKDVLICRPYQVCRRLRGVLRNIVWDELDLAPSEAEIHAAEESDEKSTDTHAQFNASHMLRLRRVLASLHPEAGFAAWGSARAVRLRFSSVAENDAEIEEAYATVELVSSLARASPSIGEARVQFREMNKWELFEERHVFATGHPHDGRWPRISSLIAALGAMPNLSRVR
eukprot:tig00020892_g14925.t1